MAVDGPMARTVADLRLGLSVLAGRDIRDPRSVDAPLRGNAPAVRRAALVTLVPGVELPPVTIAEIERAGRILAGAGWEVEAAQPPELEQVTETWIDLFSTDFSVLMPPLRAMVSGSVYRYVMDLCWTNDFSEMPNNEIHATRSRLTRLWSAFFVRYPVVVGPTWTRLPWPVDADLEPETGLALVRDTVRFITPGNLLGLPSVALPTGVADGVPTGVQVYADLWREDLCLEAAEVIEGGVRRPTPIDPNR
jgi:amidase